MATPKYIDWDKEPLGKMPDAFLAGLLGVTEGAVGHARRKRNIKPYALGDDYSKYPAPKKVTRRIKDWRRVPLGRYPDHVLAHFMKVSVRSVARARKARGVPARDE